MAEEPRMLLHLVLHEKWQKKYVLHWLFFSVAEKQILCWHFNSFRLELEAFFEVLESLKLLEQF